LAIVEKIYKMSVKVLRWMLRHFLRVSGDWVSHMQLYHAVMLQVGAAPVMLDSRYKVLTLDEWERIIQSDVLDSTKEWKKDVFDCDNFAIAFSAHCAEYYEVNSAGIAIGTVRDADTLEEVGKHAYNILAVKENDELVLYLYEPQTDGLAKASRQVKLGNWVYETEVVVFG